MKHKKIHRGIPAALAAAALIPLAAAPAASADVEDSPVDHAVDQLFQDISNFFNPEPAANAFAIDNFTDMFAPEGTPVDQMIDAFYQNVSTAFAPEGQVDMFLESLLGVP